MPVSGGACSCQSPQWWLPSPQLAGLTRNSHQANSADPLVLIAGSLPRGLLSHPYTLQVAGGVCTSLSLRGVAHDLPYSKFA
jgi:hypothetical protein